MGRLQQDRDCMNIENIKTTLKKGIPFEITTAAGDKFRVEDEFQVALNPKLESLFCCERMAARRSYLC
jgi:hypothetical protein